MVNEYKLFSSQTTLEKTQNKSLGNGHLIVIGVGRYNVFALHRSYRAKHISLLIFIYLFKRLFHFSVYVLLLA